MKEVLAKAESKMGKTIARLESDYAAIRAGRANPAVLDKVMVDYYGAPTPVNQLAAVSVAEARVLTIQPWDGSVCRAIERAIQTSDIGINPQSDGKTIRLIFPPLTEEKRKDLVKDVSHMAEEAKIALRSIRRDAREKLKADGLDRLIKEEAAGGKPLLGICLGMQLLFEKSYEFGEHEGLGLIKGSVVPLEGRIPKELKIPHIGWNSLKLYGNCPIFKNIRDGDFVYFVHSFFAEGCGESLAATTEYGEEICAAASNKNVYGCQFHPEKSGETGLAILRAFCSMEVSK